MDADILEAPSGGPAQQAAQVVDVAVHSAIGAEPNQVKGLAIGEQLVGQGVEGWIGGNAAVLDGLANPHQFLANNPARTNGEVPYLGVAHLAIRQANGPTTGFNQGVGIGMPKGIHDRCCRGTDGVMGFLMAVAPAIENG